MILKVPQACSKVPTDRFRNTFKRVSFPDNLERGHIQWLEIQKECHLSEIHVKYQEK